MSSSHSRVTSGATPQSDQTPEDISAEDWDNASSALKIKWLLSDRGNDAKWGWVVYRTSYKPELDVAWEILQRLIVDKSHKNITRSDAPDVLDKMDWVFVSDPTRLDGASREDLRRLFSEFVRGEAPHLAKEGPLKYSRGSRYEIFLQADEDALLSLLHESGGGGHVNIVRGWLDPLPAGKATDEDGQPFDPEDWMKMRVGLVGPENYVEMDDTESWYVYYQPPPHGVWAS